MAESAIAGYIKAPGDAPVNGGDILVAEVQEPSRCKSCWVGSPLVRVLYSASSLCIVIECGRAPYSALANDDNAAEAVALLDNFPRTMHGAALLCLDDNINTDGIYPGKYTYREDIDAATQAKVVMENYDERFAALVQPGASHGDGDGGQRAGGGSFTSSLNE